MEGGLFSQMSWLCVCCDFWHAGALGAGPGRGAWRRAREATIHGVVWVDDLFSKSVSKHPPGRGIAGGCVVCLEHLAEAEGDQRFGRSCAADSDSACIWINGSCVAETACIWIKGSCVAGKVNIWALCWIQSWGGYLWLERSKQNC